MKKTIIAICCLAGFAAHAQNNNLNFNYALKFSNTMQYSNDPHPYNSLVTDKTTTWVDPSLSFIIKNQKGNFHELELLDLSIDKHEQNLRANSSVYPNYDYSSQSLSTLTLRYHYQQNFLKSQKTKWMPFVAVGASFGVQIGRYYNEDPDIKEYSFTNLTYIGYVSPGVSYNISKRFFATVSLPVTLFDGYSVFGKNSSNTYNLSNSSYEDNYLRAFPQRITGKFSLALKL